MKHKHFLCAAGLAACMLAGCAQKSQTPYIGTEEAKRLALEDAGIPASEAEFTTASLTSRSGQDYYQIDFISAGESYKYDIDAITGIIIQAATPEDNSKTDADTAADSGLDTNADADSGLNAGTAAADANTEITPGEAKEKALAHAKLTNMQVTFVKCELGHEHGHYVYEIEFYTADRKEYDYEIDAFSGEVVSFDYETDAAYIKDHSDTEDHSYTEHHSETEAHHYTADNKITAEKAKELALAQVPGAAARHIREFETDYDDGRMEYEGKIVYNGMEYEFEIDAYSGAFRSWSADPADD